MNAKILYVGRFGLPDTAPGIRVYNIIKVLKNLGYDVEVISNMGVHRGGAETQEYDEIRYAYVNILGHRNKLLNTISSIYELLLAKKTFRKIKAVSDTENPHAIILYNDLYRLTKKLIPYCKKNNIKLIADVTEWYEKRKSKAITDRLLPVLTEKRIKKLDNRLDGVIAISGYLYEFYKSNSCNVICVPPLFDVLAFPKPLFQYKKPLNIIYAGFPGAKDIILPIIKAIDLINKTGIRIELDLIGIDSAYLKNHLNINKTPRGVKAYGSLPHEEVIQRIHKADFSFLFRHNLRYAKAGFSTKLAECMLLGVPMLCNKIGGTDLVIRDSVTGFLIDDTSEETVCRLLEKLLAMDGDEIVAVKTAAYHFAEEFFARERYEKSLYELVGGKESAHH